MEDATLAKAIGPGRTPIIFFGAWPKATFAQFLDEAQSSVNYQQGALYRYRGGRFQLLKKTGWNTYYEGAYYPGDGRLGALLWSYLDGFSQTWIEILEGSKKGPLATPATVSDGQARIGIHTMLSLRTGHLFTYGPDNSTPTTEGAIERWDPGQPRSVIERPPLPEGTHLEAVSLNGSAPTDVYLCGKLEVTREVAPAQLYMARFDGSAWSRLHAPVPIPLEWPPRCKSTADGGLWLLALEGDRPALYHRTRDGSWSVAQLPAPQDGGSWDEAVSFIAAAPDDLWLLLRRETEPARLTLFRTKPVGAVLRFGGK